MSGDIRGISWGKRWGIPYAVCAEVEHDRIRVAGAPSGRLREFRTVLIPLRTVIRFQHSQAGKDWSESVARRVMEASLCHPRMMGVTVVEPSPSSSPDRGEG